MLHFPRGEKYVALLRQAAEPAAAAALDAERARLRALVRAQLAEAALLGDADEGAALAARQGLAHPAGAPDPSTWPRQAAGAPGDAAAEDVGGAPSSLAVGGGSGALREAPGHDGSGGAEEARTCVDPEPGPGRDGKRRRVGQLAAVPTGQPARDSVRPSGATHGQPSESSKRREFGGTAADETGPGSGFALPGADAGALGASDDFFLDVEDADAHAEAAGEPPEPLGNRVSADAGSAPAGQHEGVAAGGSAPRLVNGSVARRAPADPAAGSPASKAGSRGGRAGSFSAKLGPLAGKVRPRGAPHSAAREAMRRRAPAPGAAGQSGRPGSRPAGAPESFALDARRSAGQSAQPAPAEPRGAGRKGPARGRPAGGGKLRKLPPAGEAFAAAPQRAGADAARLPQPAAAGTAHAGGVGMAPGLVPSPGRPGAPAEAPRRTRAEGGRKRRRK